MLSLSSPQRRLLAFYEWRRGTSAVTTVANINAVFGEKSVNYSTVHRWFTRFEEGDTDFEDKPRSGRPTTVEDSTILEVIKENPEASVRELATKIGCSHMTIDRRLSNLGYRKVLAQWIPHALTDGQRMTRLSICQSLLLRSNRKDFLEDTVPHPPAPFNYHLFRPLGSFLAKKKYSKLDDVFLAVADFFDAQTPGFWEKGISDLPIRWSKVVDSYGDYIVD